MLLFPGAYANSVFHIDYPKLYQMGYRGILFDIDNTLVHHGDDATPEVEELFQALHKLGFTTLLLSNNGEGRVRRFIKNIDTLFICNADKPKNGGYQRALDMMQLRRSEALCIGDQIFTDILGANRSRIDSILVHYIAVPGERKIGIRRRLEQVILTLYRHSRSRRNKLCDIVLEEKRAYAEA